MQNKKKDNVKVKITKQAEGKLIEVFISDTVTINDCLTAKQKNESGKIIKKITSGWKPSGDKNLPDGVNIEMTVDAENDRYKHRVIDKKTGLTIHKEDMKLSEHK